VGARTSRAEQKPPEKLYQTVQAMSEAALWSAGGA